MVPLHDVSLSTLDSPARERTIKTLRWTAIGLVLALFIVGVPLLNLGGIVPDYKVNMLGKYLCLCLVALGIDLIWGYTGLLSLCQALFFCLGGYAMAMHLSLPEGGGIYAVPQFLSFAYYGHANPLPPFWRPFHSLAFTMAAIVAVPAVVATVFGFFILRSRVRGVYFSIVTQAVAWGAWLTISRNEMLLGGTNGLTNFSKAMTSDRVWILGLYLTTVLMILIGYLACLFITRSRLGRVLVAIRDKETRLYFAGYRPYAFKVFAFAVAGVLAGIGGALYAPQVGIITPQNMNVEASINMVVLVAVGGRGRLWGSILGALVVSYAMASLTSDIPDAWPFILGGIYVSVVLFFPDGLGGLWDKLEEDIRAGHSLRGVAKVAPMIVICLFVIAEALALMPAFLNESIGTIPRVGPLQWKYVLMIGLIAGFAILAKTLSKSPKKPDLAFEDMSAVVGEGSMQ